MAYNKINSHVIRNEKFRKRTAYFPQRKLCGVQVHSNGFSSLLSAQFGNPSHTFLGSVALEIWILLAFSNDVGWPIVVRRTVLYFKYSTQVQCSGSSDLSAQSATLLQNLVFEIHLPFLHCISPGAQRNRCWHKSAFSSRPSWQSDLPSHTWLASRQLPNGHRMSSQCGVFAE